VFASTDSREPIVTTTLRTAAFAACLIPVLAWASDDKDKDKANPNVDKKTAELMKKLGTLYKDAKSLHTDAVIETTVDQDGQDKREIKVKMSVDLERPNRFARNQPLPTS